MDEIDEDAAISFEGEPAADGPWERERDRQGYSRISFAYPQWPGRSAAGKRTGWLLRGFDSLYFFFRACSGLRVDWGKNERGGEEEGEGTGGWWPGGRELGRRRVTESGIDRQNSPFGPLGNLFSLWPVTFLALFCSLEQTGKKGLNPFSTLA